MTFKYLVLVFGIIFLFGSVSAFDTYINNTNIFVDGSVGIGTNSPSSMFHVVGDARIEGDTRVLNSDFIVNKDLTIGYENLTHGKLRFDDSTERLQFSNDNGSNWIDFTELNKAGISWTPRSNPVDADWHSVVYGNGLFVATAYSGPSVNLIMTSPDGVTWTERASPVYHAWRSVTYGDGLFVTVSYTGTGSRAMTSPDGVTWTTRSTPADYSWRSVTYGNGTFVAVSSSGTGNRVMTSSDGISWTLRNTPVDNDWYSVTYGDGLFVATSISGTGNRVMTSPDGITWTSRSTPVDNDWYSVTYGNGLFVAVSSDGTGDRVMTSPDGINWTIRSTPIDNSWRSVAYGSGLFVAVSSDGTGDRVMTSPDGITWTSRSTPLDNSWRSVAYGNGLFVAVANSGTGNRVMTSGTFISGGVETSSSVWDKDGSDVSYVGGNVGVGTSSPSSMFHVVGNSTFAGALIPGSNNTYSLGSPSMQWKDLYVSNGTVYIGGFGLSSDEGSLKWDGGHVAHEGKHWNNSGNNVTADYFFGDGSQLTGISGGLWTNSSGDITYNGDVGIGESNVTSKLHVSLDQGNQSWSPIDTIATFEDDAFAFIDIVGDSVAGIKFSDNEEHAVGGVHYDHAENLLSFISDGGEKVWIDTNGRVGIGTSTPSHALNVVGDLNVTGTSYLGDVTLTSDGIVGIGTNSPDSTLDVRPFNSSTIALSVTSPTDQNSFTIWNNARNAIYLNINENGDVSFQPTNKVTFSAGKSVGIGDSTPDSLLDVHSSSSAAGIDITSLGTDTDATLSFELTDGSASFTVGVDDSDDDKFKISTTALGANDRFVIDSSGNVGIGTDNPETKLVVQDSDSGANASATDHANLLVESSGSSGITIGSGSSHMGGLVFGDSNNVEAGYVKYSHINNMMYFGNNNSNSLVIDSNGKIGIGTSIPTGALTVKGSGGISSPATSGSTQTGHIARFYGASPSSATLDIGIGNAGTAWIQATDVGDLAGSYKMSLNPNGGNVGIGTDNPGYKLQVSDSSASQVLSVIDSSNQCQFGVDGAGWTASCSSDERLKDNIASALPILDRLMGLRVRSYDWISSGESDVGLIAQEYGEVFPERVSVGDDGYLQIDTVTDMDLLRGLQELNAKVENLENENDLLKEIICEELGRMCG